MVFRAATLTALLVATSATIIADDHVEDPFFDVRLGYVIADNSYDGTFDGTTGDEFEQDWDAQHRAFLQLMYSPGLRPFGWLFGVDVTGDFRDTDSDDSDADIEYQAWSAHLHIGVGYRIGDIAQLELVPFGGAGVSDTKRRTIANGDDSDEDTVLEYGVNFNAFLTLDRFIIGAQIGYLYSDSSAEFRDQIDPNENVEYDWQSGSVTYSGFIGIRF